MITSNNRMETLKKLQQEERRKKESLQYSKMRFQLLFRLREEDRAFCKMVGYDYDPITEQEEKEIEFLQWESGLIESHSLTSDEVKEVERINIEYFLKIYYGTLPANKPTDEVANKIEKTLCALSPETISELRKITWVKPKNHPSYREYYFLDVLKRKILNYVSGQNLELENELSDDVLQEIKVAFEPLN